MQERPLSFPQGTPPTPGEARNRSSEAIFRLTLLVGYLAVIYNPLLKLALPEGANDPWEIRVAFSLLWSLNCTLAIIWPWYRERFKTIGYVTYYLTSVWLIWLMFANDFMPEYVMHYLLSVFIQFPLFYKVRDLSLFGITHMVLTSVAALAAEEVLVSPFYLALLVVGLFIAGMLPLIFRMRLGETQEQGKRLQRIINKSVMQNAEEGIYVVDNQNKPLASNHRLQKIWNLPDALFQSSAQMEAMEHVRNMLVQPDMLDNLFRRAELLPGHRANGLLNLRNGSFIECRSEALMQDGTKIGMVWYFRDVTSTLRREQELAEKSRRSEQFNSLLQRLATSPHLKIGNLEAFFEELTKSTAEFLNLDRLGIWLYANGEEVLVMQKQYNRGDKAFMKGVEFFRSKHPAYFKALSAARLLIIPNTLEDDRITSYESSFAPTLRPRSLMDAPLITHGEMVGILCADNNGGNSVWSEQEQNFFLSVADLVSLALEVSRRVKVEEELERNVALLRNVFDTMGSGILVVSLHKKVLDYNKEYLQIWNLTPEKLNQSPEEVIQYCNAQLANAPTAMEQFRDLMERTDYVGLELLEFKDGRIVERLVRPLLIGEEVVGRIFIYRDITQRVTADLALKNSERSQKAILNALPDIIIRVGRSGNILDYKVPSALAGHMPSSIAADATLVMVIQGQMGERLQEEVRQALDDQHTRFFEAHLDAQDENSPIMEARIVPSGEREALVVLRDITSRKRSEQELMKRNFELDSFVYRASHDLKAPLNSVMGLIQIAQAETSIDALKSYLHLMDKSVVKLDTFIRNLNEFSRITRLETQLSEVDLKAKVSEILESLQFLEHYGRPSIQVDCPEDMRILADAFHLEIVLANLVSNAIKYQDFRKDQSWIRITARLQDGQAVLEVADNGVGIARDHLDKVFSLFFRATNQSFGSGLGLYITENAVRKMGGKLEVESVEKEGTTFRLLLPQATPGGQLPK